MNDKETQQKYLELHLLNTQIKQLTQQLALLEQQLLELRISDDSLEDFKNIKNEKESFVPLVGGIFVKSKLENNKNVLINVGQGIIVEKSIDEARNMVSMQEKEVKKIIKQIEDGLYTLSIRSQSMQQELVNIKKE